MRRERLFKVVADLRSAAAAHTVPFAALLVAVERGAAQGLSVFAGVMVAPVSQVSLVRVVSGQLAE
jgi:hypothetical protein